VILLHFVNIFSQKFFFIKQKGVKFVKPQQFQKNIAH